MSRQRRIDGIVSGSIDLVSAEGEKPPATRVRWRLDNVSVDRRMVTRRLEGDVSVRPGVIAIRSIRGSFAGGQLTVIGQWAPSRGVLTRETLGRGTGRLEVRAASIDVSRALLLVEPAIARTTSGLLSGRLTVETGVNTRARGSVELRRSVLSGIPMGDAHAGVSANLDARLERWALSLHAIEASLGTGRIYGDANLRSSSRRPGAFSLASQWRAQRVDFGRLLDEVGQSTTYAQGALNGTLTLNGDGIRSARDLTGRFDAELDGTQARAVPGLTSAQAYLGAFSLASTRFDQGRVRGSIGAGVARIEEFWLLSERVRVTADGLIQLASGNMDVAAVVSTGNFELQNVAIAAATESLALQSAVPFLAIARVNRLLSNRTLYLDVIGPLADPRIRLKPLNSLGQEAVRFAVREAAATVLPISVTGGGLLSTGRDR
jgi:hypothetical protein